MRKIFFVKVVCVLVVLCFMAGCASMFIIKEEQPTPQMVEELQALLDSVDYRPYINKWSIFDCSNKTALLYDFLTLKGYKCIIIGGTEFLLSFIFEEEEKGHTWLTAEKYGKKFWIESTTKEIVQPDYFKRYFWRISYSSLEEAKRVFHVLGLYGEWEY